MGGSNDKLTRKLLFWEVDDHSVWRRIPVNLFHEFVYSFKDLLCMADDLCALFCCVMFFIFLGAGRSLANLSRWLFLIISGNGCMIDT